MRCAHRMCLVLGLASSLAGTVLICCYLWPASTEHYEVTGDVILGPASMAEITLSAESLAHADPSRDAREAFRSNDVRLVALRGYSTIVPGVSEYWTRLCTNQGLKVIRGTSDVLSNRNDWAFRAAATDYARKYNRTLLELTESRTTTASETNREAIE